MEYLFIHLVNVNYYLTQRHQLQKFVH